MSSQGSNSGINGRLLEGEVRSILESRGIQFEEQVERFFAYAPGLCRNDFILRTPTGEVVIECKYFSGQKGTIWQKIAFTILSLGLIKNKYKVRYILILGGKYPKDWRYSYFISSGIREGVDVVTIDGLEGYIDANWGKPS